MERNRPHASTGISVPARSLVSSGVRMTAPKVEHMVSITDNATSVRAMYDTTFDAVPPGQQATRIKPTANGVGSPSVVAMPQPIMGISRNCAMKPVAIARGRVVTRVKSLRERVIPMPSMMIARNISWETKSDTPTEFGVNIKTPKDFSDIEDYDMRYYKTDKLGLLPQAVLDLKVLRNEYKKMMKESKNKSDYVKWNNNQLAVKRLMASFYGIVAFQGFGWADVDLAASITASAREAIREAAFKVRELE